MDTSRAPVISQCQQGRPLAPTHTAALWNTHLDLPKTDTNCPPPTLPGSRGGSAWGLALNPAVSDCLDLGGRSHEMAPLVWRKPNLHLDMLGRRTWLGGLAEGDLQRRREKGREKRRWEEREGELQVLGLVINSSRAIYGVLFHKGATRAFPHFTTGGEVINTELGVLIMTAIGPPVPEDILTHSTHSSRVQEHHTPFDWWLPLQNISYHPAGGRQLVPA